MPVEERFTSLDRVAFEALVDDLAALPAQYSDAGRDHLLRMVQGDPDAEDPDLFYVAALNGNWGMIHFDRGVLYTVVVPTTSQVIGESPAELLAALREQEGWLEQRLGNPVRVDGVELTRMVFQLPAGGELSIGIGNGVTLMFASPAHVAVNDVVVPT